MDESQRLGEDILKDLFNELSSDIQVWISPCLYSIENTKKYISGEIDKFSYTLCQTKQSNINVLKFVRYHRITIEQLLYRCQRFKRILKDHGYSSLLKKVVIKQSLLLDMLLELQAAEISLLEYDNKIRLLQRGMQ
ncbi:hypothetical protein CDAR_433671 [Caerostris darwini]|uniref:Uncharacterized protein n=1 Tax=Caerostris darwini TaxID=1538125 RepID=A0AAV4PIA8_9ARAC|nr:hypothetical protein CDAR_433671 [Caerostris darwini]